MQQEVVLAMLAKEPSQGYQLRARMNDALGPLGEALNAGQIYVTLGRLESADEERAPILAGGLGSEVDVDDPRRGVAIEVVLERRTRAVRGSADNPMTQAEVEAKALDLIGGVLGARRARGIVRAVAHLETIPDVTALRRLWQSSAKSHGNTG